MELRSKGTALQSKAKVEHSAAEPRKGGAMLLAAKQGKGDAWLITAKQRQSRAAPGKGKAERDQA